MKALRDPQNLLSGGLAAIRAQFSVPEGFAPVVARTKASGVLPGTRIEVRLIGADTARRQLQFERNG